MEDNGYSIIFQSDKYFGKAIKLYRVVGVREHESIYKNKIFISGMNSLEGRQFAFTEKEVINYAATDKSKIAIAKVTIPEKILTNLDFSDNIDVNIFTNGVITVHPEENEFFIKSIIQIEIKERIWK